MLGSFTRVGRASFGLRADRGSVRPAGLRIHRARLMAVSYEDEGFETSVEPEKKRGVVKWFDTKKGYGFIQATDGSGDVFVHQTNIVASGYRSLKEGETVEFLEDDSEGRMRAIQVTGPDGAPPIVQNYAKSEGSQMIDPFTEDSSQRRSSTGYNETSFVELGRFSTGLQVVVHNLPWSVTSERLMEFFAAFNAATCEIVYDDMGRSRGYAIIKFDEKTDAERAIEEMHMANVDGRNVIVRFDRYG